MGLESPQEVNPHLSYVACRWLPLASDVGAFWYFCHKRRSCMFVITGAAALDECTCGIMMLITCCSPLCQRTLEPMCRRLQLSSSALTSCLQQAGLLQVIDTVENSNHDLAFHLRCSYHTAALCLEIVRPTLLQGCTGTTLGYRYLRSADIL